MSENDTLTAVPGIRVGHATLREAATGCTVILCPPGTVGAVDVRGGAPGTRETDLLRPENLVQRVDAVMLAGGSAFGLAAADGAMRYLAEQGQGYMTGSGVPVPIVPAAILYDLGLGASDVYPDAALGYAACLAASDAPVEEGSVGAGTGAMCGALRGPAYATKGGVGSASKHLGDGLYVGALVAVNAFGDVLDESGQLLAGLRDESGALMGVRALLPAFAGVPDPGAQRENTLIGVVATNARLDKAQTLKLAQMTHVGIARAVDPAHTPYDGDALFALATGERPANLLVLGAFAADAVAQAIRRAVRAASSLAGVRALNA